MSNTLTHMPSLKAKRTKEAGPAKLRAAAHARIEIKRKTSDVQRLFELADLPENRIRISREALEVILISFPGDPD